MRSRYKALALVLLAAFASSAACGGPDTFELGGSRGACITSDSMAWGDTMVRPPVDYPVQISHVELIDANGIELVETSLMPKPNFGNIEYPPSRKSLREYGIEQEWDARKNVDEVVIPPGSDRWDLILGFKATREIKGDTHASFGDVLVHFIDPYTGDEIALGNANLDILMVEKMSMCDKIPSPTRPDDPYHPES